MAYETKNMSGALFPNENRTSDKAPHFKGDSNVEGTMWKVAAWKTTSKAGKKYLSLKYEPPQEGGFKQANEKPQEKDPWDD